MNIKNHKLRWLISSSILAVILILYVLSNSISGSYYCSLYGYLDGGEYWVRFQSGKVWLNGENSAGIIHDNIGTYEKLPNGNSLLMINDGSTIELSVHVLGLRISEKNRIKMGIKTPKIGVDFIRIPWKF